jgi:hypothetical protein
VDPLRRRGGPPDGRPPQSERLLIPQPLIKRRLPSGRGASEQPNVTSDGETRLTPAFWAVLVATGVAAGLFGDALMYLLFTIEHVVFGYHTGDLETGVAHASSLRRVVPLLVAGRSASPGAWSGPGHPPGPTRWSARPRCWARPCRRRWPAWPWSWN